MASKRELTLGFRSRFLLTIASISVYGLLQVGCGQEKSHHQTLTKEQTLSYLSRGRVIERHQQEVISPLSLALANVAPMEVAVDSRSGETRWILFNLDYAKSIEYGHLENYLKDWWHQHGRSLGLTSFEQLEKLKNGEKWLTENQLVLSFSQKMMTVPVRDAYVDAVFVRVAPYKFKLREIVNQSSALPVESESLNIDFQELKAKLGWSDAQLVANQEILIPDYRDGHLKRGSKFTVYHQNELYDWTIKGNQLEIVDAYSHRLSVIPKVNAEVYDRSYLDDQMIRQALPLTKVVAGDRSILTSPDGFMASDWTPRAVQLESPRVIVYQDEASRPEVIALESGEDHSEWIADDPQTFAALNAYTAVHRINRYVRQFLSDQVVPFLNQTVEVRVNVEGQCNAYYTTVVRKITLFSAGGGCANIALINDVIYHEWGHGLDDHTGRSGGVTDGAFSEGIGDIVSAYFTGDPTIGRGFYIDYHDGIRTLENDRTYPKDVGAIHKEGGIIAGTFWDLRLALEERYGIVRGQYLASYFFFRHLLLADSYQDSYQIVLRLDDPDGNAATPGPNSCLINKVFSKRGLAEPMDCEDQVQPAYQLSETDEDLFLAITEESQNHFSLVASSKIADHMAVCIGEREQCLSEDSDLLTLKKVEGTKDRQFFSYQGLLDLKSLDLVTIIAKNKQGQIIGSRVVKVVSK